MTREEFLQLSDHEKYVYFRIKVRQMREIQKDLFKMAYSVFDKWKIEDEVDSLLRWV